MVWHMELCKHVLCEQLHSCTVQCNAGIYVYVLCIFSVCVIRYTVYIFSVFSCMASEGFHNFEIVVFHGALLNCFRITS